MICFTELIYFEFVAIDLIARVRESSDKLLAVRHVCHTNHITSGTE